MPALREYRVSRLSSAAFVAAITASGGSKSGSPTAKEITSGMDAARTIMLRILESGIASAFLEYFIWVASQSAYGVRTVNLDASAGG